LIFVIVNLFITDSRNLETKSQFAMQHSRSLQRVGGNMCNSIIHAYASK